ncbi:MFS transporter [Catalinimonas alkaloidigena]|uniref:MFS transporter n=1 Tax=Catalinimonas alkaloidigena TaxID=1075417 RepID=UPI003B8A8D50
MYEFICYSPTICLSTRGISGLRWVITGVFGGVVASIAYAIIADLFKADQRGRAMGLLQIAFAVSLVGGLPLTLYLSSKFNWQGAYAFIFLIGFGFILWMGVSLKPLRIHLYHPVKKSSWQHLSETLLNKRHAFFFFQ